MSDKPESTAARVALWRALHVELDAAPHVLEDDIGLKLLAPDDDWRRRGDMDSRFTRPSERPSWRGRASSRTWSKNRPAAG